MHFSQKWKPRMKDKNELFCGFYEMEVMDISWGEASEDIQLACVVLLWASLIFYYHFRLYFIGTEDRETKNVKMVTFEERIEMKHLRY